jgi:formate-dependent nitrite reductase membrane component NrfD
MHDTFFTASPEWSLFIVPYFFVGGIAGGSYFLAAMLHWLGRPEDQRVVRLGYIVAFFGAVLSGILLIVDLGQPLRFWHMLFQSERFPLPVLKAWSPMSAGAWALFFFGMFATMSAAGALAYENRVRWSWLRVFYDGWLGRIIALIGAFFGFFIAGYTGVLLSVTNRPIWADTHWLGVLFLISAASTAAATLILIARWRGGPRVADSTVEWLVWFDGWVLILELIVLFIFLLSLGSVATVWLSWRGLLLFLLVIMLGIIVPLAFHFRPDWFRERWRSRRVVAGAWLVLIGGFFLRFITLLASETLHAPRSGLQSAGLWP